MKKIVFATNNAHKLEEIRAIAGSQFEIVSLAEIGCTDDIPETADTLEGNALIKARWVKEKYGYDCFADDTGLMVRALNERPGVYTARYAGPECSPDDNIRLMLREMQGKEDRKARFETVIALILDGKEHTFRGVVEGEIATGRRGEGGFGYDPIFIPDEISTGNGETGVNAQRLAFAEMTSEEKNSISHRGRATRKLVEFLTTL